MSSSLEEQFEAAAETARHIRTCSQDQKKTLYGLFKQATEGPMDIDHRPRPGIFDPVGRAKWDSWYSLKDLSKEQAKQQYIQFVETILKQQP
jgi:acyl-CoA-binding protein